MEVRQKRELPAPPSVTWKRPTLILDSGRSVGESVFLDRMRHWMHTEVQARVTIKRFTPSVYIMYPGDYCKPRYGAYPVNQYDQWEIRPVRWRGRQLAPGGFMESVAQFHPGAFRRKHKAPWNTYQAEEIKPILIYLNPTLRDLRWATRHHEQFLNPVNCASMMLGQPQDWTFPRNAHEWMGGCWGFDVDAVSRAKKAYKGLCHTKLPWWKWWKKDRESKEERPLFGLAENFEDTEVRRYPSMALKWCDNRSQRWRDEKTWQSLIRATWCQFYIIASTREAVPFDAMIAAARGATLIAPDVSAFRKIPGKHWLYPAAETGGGSILWNQTDTELWVKGKLQRHGLDRTH